MSTTSQTPRPAAQTQNRRKKVRAVMASGLVLGVGAAVTLAAWSDTAWGEGTFGTTGSDFNIQASFDGGTSWDEYVTPGDAGPMTFAQNADSLIPGEPVYQLVGLSEAEGNLGADVVLTRTNADESGLSDLVTVAVADVGAGGTAPACGADAVFGTGATIGSPASDMLDTTVAADGYRWICFSATLDADATLDAADELSDPILWEFAATSQDPA
jgi:predicted ribosomally synthesized peptide with SipW-like signal peptide